MRGEVLDLGLTTRDQPAMPWCVAGAMSDDATSGGGLYFSENMAGWVIDAAKRLDALGRLRPGWDSHGGLALRRGAKTFAITILKSLSTVNLPVPGVVLGSGGTVHLEWRARGKELDIGLGDSSGIEFMKVAPGGAIEEGTTSSNIPRKVHELSDWLLE